MTNNSTVDDTTPPTLVSAAVRTAGTLVALEFDENLYAAGASSAYEVFVSGASLTVSSATRPSDDRDEILLSVTPATIPRNAPVSVTYTDPTAGNDQSALQDTAGNDVATFTTGSDGVPAVENNSTVAGPPGPADRADRERCRQVADRPVVDGACR